MKEIIIIIFFMIGNLIGASFFQLPSELGPLGFNLISSWFIALFVALIFAWIFGQLSVLNPHANILSDYFEDVSIKKSVAFLYWIAVVIANMLFLEVPGLNIGNYSILLAFFIIFILSLLNHYLDYSTIANIEIVLSLLKFLILFLLPIFCYFSNNSVFTLPSTNIHKREVIKYGIMCFWSFLGIELVSVFGKGKKVRNGLIVAVIASFLLYLLSSILIIGLLNVNELNNQISFVVLLNNIGYTELSKYLGILTVFVCIGTLYGWIAGISKMVLHSAEADLFPSIFLKKSKSGVSIYGLWISSIITFLSYLITKFPYIKDLFMIQTTFSFVVNVCLSMFFVIFVLCAYKLIAISENYFDKIVGFLGIILGLISLSMNILNSTLAICLFTLFYLYHKYF